MRAKAEHIGAASSGKISVGKPLAGKNRTQTFHIRHTAGKCGFTGIYRRGDIFRPLHSALYFERAYAGGGKLPDMFHI